MPDIIIAPGDHSSHNNLVLTTTSNATANGIDTNSATARLSRHGQPLNGESLYLTLSGNALFTQGGQQAIVTTDNHGEAIVYFTDTQQETVEVICHYHQTQARGISHFNEDARVSENISGEVLQNNVQANGVAQNSMRYSVYDAQRTRIANVQLDFQTTGSAVLSAQGGQTNQQGQFTLTLTNRTPEQVLVSASVRGLVGIDNHTYLNFTPFSPQYRILVHVLTDNSPPGQANAIQYEVVSSSTLMPVQGILLIYDAPSNIQLTPGGVTTAQGLTTLSMVSGISGRFTIKASISTESLTVNNTDINWAN